MEIRRVRREEIPEVRRLHSVVYTNPSDLTVKEEDIPGYDNVFALFEQGKLCSVMNSIEFRSMHDGRIVPTAGIAGVGTFPEYRRKGHVRKLFDTVFADMREKGQVFSTLYPFSFPYYRMFGYELVYTANEVGFPLAGFDPKRIRGSLEQVTAVSDEIASLYRGFISGRNLAFDRGAREWKKRFPENPCKDQVYCYLYRDERGEPAAYFIFKVEPEGRHNFTLACRDFAWRGAGTLAQVLTHLSIFHPRAGQATIHLPSDARPELIIGEPHELTHKRRAAYMGRVVDVERALEATRWNGEGKLVLGIRDEVLSWNRGSWEVSWEQGEAKVKRTTGAAELTMDVSTLAQLLSGFIGGDELIEYRLADTGLPKDELARIFPAKVLYQNDQF